MPNLPAGVSVSWTVQGQGLTAASGNTGPSFTVTTTGQGQAIVQATLTDPCGNATYLTFNVGAGNPLQIDPVNGTCGFQATAYAPGYSGLQWQINLDDPQAGFEPSVFVPFRGSVASATLSGYDACTGQYRSVTVTRQAPPGTYCGGTAPGQYRVYPNPASDEVTVAQGDEANARQGSAAPAGSSAAGDGGGFTVRVYDGYGALRHTASTSGLQVRLRTGMLPSGLYVLVITDAGTGAVVRRQLEVTR